MSERYIISCNNTADLPPEFLETNALPVACLGYSIGGESYNGRDAVLEPKAFYALMREGKETKTFQVNPDGAKELLEPLVQQGYDVLHLAFSSGLSGTFSSMKIAAEELREKYPERRVVVVDTLCASMGEGLMVYKALQMKSGGASLDEVKNWVEENKLRLCHYFTVDDLNHLYRGGRVSKTAAVVGTMLGIKPVLHVDNEGKLIPVTKIRGRKQSIAKLVDYMEELTKGVQNDTFFISHGDCADEAEYLAKLIEERLGIQNHMISFVGPTIGSHSGPGTLALFFFGEKR